ncbi:MAG: spore coat protein [Clostridiales bacterium]|jgi:spore coat protein CotF|nr:spore coat protein [Clostridiales bacterium]
MGNLTEKDMLHDMLVLEKDIVKYYGSYLIEASCPELRKTLNQNLQASADDQFSVFNAMQSRGYYSVKDAPEQEVAQAKDKFGNMLGAMN